MENNILSSPFFSICIPNYNYALYLAETIDSVLKQEYRDFEIIISDNASTDNSWEVIQTYVKKDKRIKAFKNNYNVGFAPNLQKVTEKASGEFFLLLSADDIMMPGALEIYHQIIRSQENEALVLHSAFFHIDSNGKKISIVYRESQGFRARKVNIQEQKLNETYLYQIWDSAETLRFAMRTNLGIGAFLTVLYPKSLWKKVEGYDVAYQIFPDKAFLFKILTENVKYIYINRALFGYRIHNQNQNATNSNQKALKHQMDGYLRCITLPQQTLEKAGLTRLDLQKAYVKNLILKHAAIELQKGSSTNCFRILSFGFGTFPSIMKIHSITWILIFLTLLGPLGTLIVKKFKHLVN